MKLSHLCLLQLASLIHAASNEAFQKDSRNLSENLHQSGANEVSTDALALPVVYLDSNSESVSQDHDLSNSLPRLNERELKARYLNASEMNWVLLLKEFADRSPEEQTLVFQLLKMHWPKSDDPLTTGLLMEAFYMVRLFITRVSAKKVKFPCIPGHYKLIKALAELQIIETVEFPCEALYHEDTDVVLQYGRNLRICPSSLKKLLKSGNPRAIANLKALFPPVKVEVNGEVTPLMSWPNLKKDSRMILAIYYHANTHHEALLAYLSTVAAIHKPSPTTQSPTFTLMNSSLCTADVLQVLDPKLIVSEVFSYPHRLLEVLAVRAYKGISIEVPKMQEEGFTGPYSNEIASALTPAEFFSIAVLAGADDEFLKSIILNNPKCHHEMFLVAAIAAGKSLEFIKFIRAKLMPSDLKMFFIEYHVPKEYRPCLFQSAPYGICYTKQFYMHTADDLRNALQLLTPMQLKEILDRPIKPQGELELVMYDELFKQQNTDKKQVIEEFLISNHLSVPFQVALLAQSCKYLQEQIMGPTDFTLKACCQTAIIAKFDYASEFNH